MFIFIHKKTVKKLKKCPNTEKSRYLSIQVAITIIVQNALHLQFDKNVKCKRSVKFLIEFCICSGVMRLAS